MLMMMLMVIITVDKECGQACKCTEERTVIVARVALGDPYYATSVRKDRRCPPERTAGRGLHQSIVANPGRMEGHHNNWQCHQEFVIFDTAQAYPTCRVHYIVDGDGDGDEDEDAEWW